MADSKHPRRRIGRIMGESGPVGACSEAKLEAHADKPSEAEFPNIAARELGGRAPRAHVVSDLACARVGSKRSCVCLLVGPCSRETAGHTAGGRKDARPAKPALAAAAFPLAGIQVLYADGGSEFGSIAIDDLLGHSESKSPSRGRAARTTTRSTGRRTRC